MRNSTLERLATGTAAGLAALIVAGGAGAAIRPDDREAHGPGAITATQRDVALRPDDRADRRFPSIVPVSQPTTGEAFDWVDAGVGSAATVGVVLLVAGGSVIVLRRGARTA
jgi:hypothetical protein